MRAQYPVPTRPNLSGADAIPLPFAAPEPVNDQAVTKASRGHSEVPRGAG